MFHRFIFYFYQALISKFSFVQIILLFALQILFISGANYVLTHCEGSSNFFILGSLEFDKETNTFVVLEKDNVVTNQNSTPFTYKFAGSAVPSSSSPIFFPVPSHINPVVRSNVLLSSTDLQEIVSGMVNQYVGVKGLIGLETAPHKIKIILSILPSIEKSPIFTSTVVDSSVSSLNPPDRVINILKEIYALNPGSRAEIVEMHAVFKLYAACAEGGQSTVEARNMISSMDDPTFQKQLYESTMALEYYRFARPK
jgi:hypothetical protein